MESEILEGAVRIGLVGRASRLHLEVASRTDRGVHARGNALTIDLEVPGPAVLPALNAISPDIWFTHAARVPEEFRVRAARQRWYRYFEPHPVGRARDWSAAARRFRGPIDVRSFGRGLPAEVPCIRDLEPIRLHRHADVLVMDIRGRSFVWGMVRKIVSALRAHATGKISLSEIESAIRGAERLSLPLAEPDRLVLWEVRHGVRWTDRALGGSRGQDRRFLAETERARIRRKVLTAIAPRPKERP